MIVNAVGIKLDKEVEIRPRGPDDVYSILLDPSKTKHDFDWEAKTPMDIGIKKAVDWYKTHGVDQTFTHLKSSESKK